MKIIIFIIILFISNLSFAGEITSPPPLSTEPVAEQHYFQEIYNNINKYDIVTSAPDGVLKGKKGQPVLYDTGITLQLWVNYDNNTDWIQI